MITQLHQDHSNRSRAASLDTTETAKEGDVKKAAAVGVLLLAVGLPPAAALSVAGSVPQHTTWTKEESPIMAGPTYVEEGEVLTIEPGVEVVFSGGSGLVVYGTLRAQGTDAEPIVFRAAGEEPWSGIAIVDTPSQQSSAIDDVRIENARIGLTMGQDAIPIHDSVFAGNEVGLSVRDPATNLTFTGNEFYSNGTAFTGKTAGVVGIYQNDFWDNDVSLFFQGRGPYECLDDPGIFEVHFNDILRGPDSPWWSYDVQTSSHSGYTGMVVDATDNWWGTVSEADIEARHRPEECCPKGRRTVVQWKEPATEPQTPAEPPGPVGNPPREGEVIGDPDYIVDVKNPEWGECVANESLTRVVTNVYEVFDLPESLPVSLARGRVRCKSFDPAARRFVKTSCEDPVTFTVPVRVNGGTGRLVVRLPRPLRSGRYTFHAGDVYWDEVLFRVLP